MCWPSHSFFMATNEGEMCLMWRGCGCGPPPHKYNSLCDRNNHLWGGLACRKFEMHLCPKHLICMCRQALCNQDLCLLIFAQNIMICAQKIWADFFMQSAPSQQVNTLRAQKCNINMPLLLSIFKVQTSCTIPSHQIIHFFVISKEVFFNVADFGRGLCRFAAYFILELKVSVCSCFSPRELQHLHRKKHTQKALLHIIC